MILEVQILGSWEDHYSKQLRLLRKVTRANKVLLSIFLIASSSFIWSATTCLPFAPPRTKLLPDLMPSTCLFCITSSPTFSNKNPLELPMRVLGSPLPPFPSSLSHFLTSPSSSSPRPTHSWLNSSLSSPVKPSSNTWISSFLEFS